MSNTQRPIYYNFVNDNSTPLVIDIETFDPGLKDTGSSNYRGVSENDKHKRGTILGVALSDGRHTEYYQLSGRGATQDISTKNRNYLKEQLSSNRPKLGHNIFYDIDWLESFYYKVNGRLHDTCIAENLINENQDSFNLDSVAFTYRLGSKSDDAMLNWCMDNGISVHQMYDHLWEMPATMVADYAKQDAELCYALYTRQKGIISTRGLDEIYNLETSLIRALLLMRKTGVPYDKDISFGNSFEIVQKLSAVEQIIDDAYDSVNCRSGKQLAPYFDALNIKYPLSPTGQPSIKQDLLKALVEDNADGPDDLGYLPNLVLIARTYGKAENDYIRKIRTNFLCESDGRIHCSFHPVRHEGFGTRSGRFSSSRPNLQQIPSPDRDGFLGVKCREPFVPVDTEHYWGKIDYSQIEFRFMAHYAVGRGSAQVRDAYNSNPDVDYHQYIMDKTGLARPFAKNLNFGIAFGMGANKMSQTFGWSQAKAHEVLEQYHDNVPFVKATKSKVESVAKRRGYIRTFLGRHAHLASQSQAYVMYNRLAQGSAADLMKKAMVELYNSGIFDVLPPHLTVHDEIDVSVPKTTKGREAFDEMKHIMETCIKLRIPVLCKATVGENWAQA